LTIRLRHVGQSAHADDHHFLRKRVSAILARSIAVYGTTTIITSPNSTEMPIAPQMF
jgi:hypothetical protein